MPNQGANRTVTLVENLHPASLASGGSQQFLDWYYTTPTFSSMVTAPALCVRSPLASLLQDAMVSPPEIYVLEVWSPVRTCERS